jgi:hypothetical protein
MLLTCMRVETMSEGSDNVPLLMVLLFGMTALYQI